MADMARKIRLTRQEKFNRHGKEIPIDMARKNSTDTTKSNMDFFNLMTDKGEFFKVKNDTNQQVEN